MIDTNRQRGERRGSSVYKAEPSKPDAPEPCGPGTERGNRSGSSHVRRRPHCHARDTRPPRFTWTSP